MVVLGVVLTGLFAAWALIEAEQRYVVLFTAFGLAGTWRQYLLWRRRRKQGSLELLATQEEYAEGQRCKAGERLRSATPPSR